MKPKILLVSALLMCATFLYAQEKVDLSEASKMAQCNLKAFQKAGIQKVMFVEFFGEFITSKETAPSTMEKRWGNQGTLKTPGAGSRVKRRLLRNLDQSIVCFGEKCIHCKWN